ncbi:MAG TPA: hypothetical protein VJR58_12690 [Vineibacter sp.]|nr:hypothetical protein [Vineibacter sp.]
MAAATRFAATQPMRHWMARPYHRYFNVADTVRRWPNAHAAS